MCTYFALALHCSRLDQLDFSRVFHLNRTTCFKTKTRMTFNCYCCFDMVSSASAEILRFIGKHLVKSGYGAFPKPLTFFREIAAEAERRKTKKKLNRAKIHLRRHLGASKKNKDEIAISSSTWTDCGKK